MATITIVADTENFMMLLEHMSPFVVLKHGANIASRLQELNYYPDGDDYYWMEKPYKFPEFWIPAINGTLHEDDLEIIED
jgi:hypothetical protein